MTALPHGLPHPASPGEQVLHTCYLNGALPGSWHWNREIKGFVVDAVNFKARLIVEVDGFSYHSSPEQYTRDRKRDRVLTLAGWRVLRFTHTEVTSDLLTVLNTIAAAVDRS